MNGTELSDQSRSDINGALQRVYTDAGFDPKACQPGIVPLYDLIGAYPIRVAELGNLSYRSAIRFLTSETGQVIPCPYEDNRALAGLLYVYQYAGFFNGCILVERDDFIARRRFSAAHELGHYILHFLPLLETVGSTTKSEALILAEGLSYAERDQPDQGLPFGQLTFARGVKLSTYRPRSDMPQMEREANQFAAELLMPSEMCELLVKRYNPRFGGRQAVLARRLASEFLISQEAMRWRLAALDLPQRSRDTYFT